MIAGEDGASYGVIAANTVSSAVRCMTNPRPGALSRRVGSVPTPQGERRLKEVSSHLVLRGNREVVWFRFGSGRGSVNWEGSIGRFLIFVEPPCGVRPDLLRDVRPETQDRRRPDLLRRLRSHVMFTVHARDAPEMLVAQRTTASS
jgi:hypothetical protein